MSNLPNFPTIRPSLLLDFANSKQVDPRISCTRASTATYFDAQGVLRTAASGVPRIDHDPVTGECKGLLIEEARTNLLKYSEQFDSADWEAARSSVTPNAIVAPDGTLTADKLAEDSASGGHYLYERLNVVAGTTYTLSVYVKSAERTRVQLQFSSTNGGFASSAAIFDIADGTIVDSAQVNSATIAAVGGGWYRISATKTAIAAAYAPVTITLISAGQVVSYTGDGSSGLYVWGAQLEVGSNPTSYIPTTSAAATRAADAASMTGTNFSEWYRQDEGTFVCKFDAPAIPQDSTTYDKIFSVNDGSQTSRMELFINGGWAPDRISALVFNSGQTKFDSANITAGWISTPVLSLVTNAFAYKQDDFAIVWSGGPVAVDASGTVSSVNRLDIASYLLAYSQLNGHISRIAYYPKRLTNAELQALTA